MTTSPARQAVSWALAQATGRAVAFLDETYSVEPNLKQRFYAMTAVVVQLGEIEGLRRGLVARVPSGYWHTSDALQSSGGRTDTEHLVDYLADPLGSEACVLAVRVGVETDDATGEDARRECIVRLMTELSSPQSPEGQVGLFMLERRRVATQRNLDAATRARAVAEGLLDARVRLLQVSPSDEPLLWLPDLVCSAWRLEFLRSDGTLFGPLRSMTRVVSA
jgi:hypothetical protein